MTADDDIKGALVALTEELLTEREAVEALQVLSEAGFMVTRPQSLLDRLADAAIAARNVSEHR